MSFDFFTLVVLGFLAVLKAFLAQCLLQVPRITSQLAGSKSIERDEHKAHKNRTQLVSAVAVRKIKGCTSKLASATSESLQSGFQRTQRPNGSPASKRN